MVVPEAKEALLAKQKNGRENRKEYKRGFISDEERYESSY